MSRVLLGIFSCHRYQYTSQGDREWIQRPTTNRVQGIRDSWLKDVTFDYKIVKGRANGAPRSDELFLNCADDYRHSTEKIRALIRYTLDNGYDYLLKIDDDVYAYWDRILKNIPTADYVGGGPFGSTIPSEWICSGMTYWLSRHSMETIINAPPLGWAEDRCVGGVLMRAGIRCAFDLRYYIAPPTRTNQYISDADLEKSNEYITIHSLSPDQMRRTYERGKIAVS